MTLNQSPTARVQDALARQPRIPLAVLPTPLHEAARLRDALGGPSRCPRILIKRDDLTALGLGGNKARKLEFLIGDAVDHGATVVLTTGAAQSNHARMTAAAARAQTQHTGGLSEEEFKKLHELRTEPEAKPRGEMVDLGTSKAYPK